MGMITCDVCHALGSYPVTMCRGQYMCPDCFQAWQRNRYRKATDSSGEGSVKVRAEVFHEKV